MIFAIGFWRKAFIKLKASSPWSSILFPGICCSLYQVHLHRAKYKSHHTDIKLHHMTFFSQWTMKGSDIWHIQPDICSHHLVLLRLTPSVMNHHIPESAPPPGWVPEWRIQTTEMANSEPTHNMNRKSTSTVSDTNSWGLFATAG